MAESQLIASIQNGNMTGIILRLKIIIDKYSPQIEVFTKSTDLPLTEEQKETIRSH